MTHEDIAALLAITVFALAAVMTITIVNAYLVAVP